MDTSVFYPQRDDTVRKEFGLGPEHILIGALGNIRPAKGYDVFLKAARIVHDKHPESRFLVAGQGSGKLYDSLLKLRKELNLENVFHFIGFRENAAQLLNNLDIFALPSISEGFSISTIEAMACGVPVVVTKSGGPEEIVKDEVDGIMAEHNEKAISSAVIRLISDIQLKNSIKSHGSNKIKEKFSVAVMIKNYCSIY